MSGATRTRAAGTPDHSNQEFITALATHVERLSDRLAKHDLTLAHRALAMVQRLQADRSSVAFLGRFSSGKSSLINCGLRRDLLPTSDLTETGVVCKLQRGRRDALIVHTGTNSLKRTSLDTASIMRHGSLRGINGEVNEGLGDVVALTVELANFPEQAIWFDTPGSAGGEESVLADEAAQRADVAVWTLGTQPFLGESEAQEIARHVKKCGPDGVALVINVRVLSSGATEARWSKAIGRLEGWMARMADLWVEVGLNRDWMPPVVCVSAKEAFASPDDFGGRELRAFLEGVDSPQASSLVGVRLRRIGWELAIIRDCVARMHEQICSRNKLARAAITAHEEASNLLWQRLQRNLQRYVAQIRERLEDLVRHDAVVAVADSVQVGALRRDGAYTVALNAALMSIREELKSELLNGLEESLVDGLSWNRPVAAKVVESMPEFQAVSVEVPNSAASNTAGVGGAFIGGLLGAVAGPWGIAAGAALGRGLQRAQHQADALRADVAGARGSVLQQASAAGTKMSTQLASSEFLGCLMETYASRRTTPEAPDGETETDLRAVLGSIDDLSVRLRAVAAGFPKLGARQP